MNNFLSSTNSKTSNYISIIGCALAGFLYCLGLTHDNYLWQNIYTILFVLFLGSLFFVNVQRNEDYREKKPYFVFIQLIILNIGIAIAAVIVDSPAKFFWVQDSLVTHLPIAEKFSFFFRGLQSSGSVQEQIKVVGLSTHLITGLSIALFGTNVFATIFAQLFFKIIAAVFIYKICNILWSKKVSFLAIQLYGLCPTLFFYNIVLSKESAVHAYYAIALYLFIQIFLERKYLYISPLILIFALINYERYYISYLLVTMIPFLTFNFPFKKNFRNISLFVIVLIVIITGIYITFYDSFNIQSMISNLQRIRLKWSSYSDVLNQYNYNIPYPLAFIKILFSPYFSPNKFHIFTDFSYLSIWGSFFNQAIILSSVMGLIRAARVKLFHLYLWIPFILFLLFAAYASPWSGRLRDSFYPLIACYSAYCLYNNKYFQKFFRLKNEITN